MDSQKTVTEVLDNLIQQQESLRKELQQVSQAIKSLRKILGIQKPGYHTEGAINSNWTPQKDTDIYNVLMSIPVYDNISYNKMKAICGLGSQVSIHNARLIKFGFIERLERGIYRLTEKGRNFVMLQIGMPVAAQRPNTNPAFHR